MSGRRFEEAGLKGMMRVWSGRAQGNGRVQRVGAGVKEQGSGEWQGSTSWRRCRGAGFRGMAGLNRMMRGRVLAVGSAEARGDAWAHGLGLADWGCSAVSARGGAR